MFGGSYSYDAAYVDDFLSRHGSQQSSVEAGYRRQGFGICQYARCRTTGWLFGSGAMKSRLRGMCYSMLTHSGRNEE